MVRQTAIKSLDLTKPSISTDSSSSSDSSLSSSVKQKELTAADLLKQYNDTIGSGSHRHAEERTQEEVLMTKLFSIRSAHLPGNNWCQDWIQWMKNNHPLLGLCCRHGMNPIGIRPRLVLLLSSVSFGLIATNLVYLLFHDQKIVNETVAKFNYYTDDESVQSFEITYEIIALWTFGGVLHSLTDLGMWHLTACACCLPGTGCHRRCGFLGKVGPYAAIAVAASLTALATLAILLRAQYEEKILIDKDDTDSSNDESFWIVLKKDKVESYGFLLTYSVELTMVYFCWYPLLSTIFFSGLIWPVFPCIGGRPKELKRQRDEARRNAQNKTRKHDQEVV